MLFRSLEAITGELKPDADIDAWATPTANGGWILEGLMPVNEMKTRLQIRQLPQESKGRYNTVAGLLMAESGDLPRQGERITVADWEFEVLALQGRRIDKVAARPLLKT